MFCFSVYLEARQLRVFSYDALAPGDWRRAQKLAREFAFTAACDNPRKTVTVERFDAVDVSTLDMSIFCKGAIP